MSSGPSSQSVECKAKLPSVSVLNVFFLFLLAQIPSLVSIDYWNANGPVLHKNLILEKVQVTQRIPFTDPADLAVWLCALWVTFFQLFFDPMCFKRKVSLKYEFKFSCLQSDSQLWHYQDLKYWKQWTLSHFIYKKHKINGKCIAFLYTHL